MRWIEDIAQEAFQEASGVDVLSRKISTVLARVLAKFFLRGEGPYTLPRMIDEVDQVNVRFGK